MPALECRDISREPGSTAPGVPIRKGAVCSNRLGKLTKSRQLSACSWVTDFECSHVTYVRACIVRAYTRRKFPPKPGIATPPATRCLFDERSKGRISLTPLFPRLATVPLNPVLFYPDATSFPFRAFPFPRQAASSYILARLL